MTGSKLFTVNDHLQSGMYNPNSWMAIAGQISERDYYGDRQRVQKRNLKKISCHR